MNKKRPVAMMCKLIMREALKRHCQVKLSIMSRMPGSCLLMWSKLKTRLYPQQRLAASQLESELVSRGSAMVVAAILSSPSL